VFAVDSGFVAPVYFVWQYTVRDDVETRVFEVRYPRRTRAVCRRHDVPGFEPGDNVTQLGEGTAIKLKDSSVITTPKVHSRLRDVAEDEEIEHQLEVLPAGGTDTAGFQLAAGATPVGAISVPTRYLHTVTESAHVDDVAATIDLLTGFLDTETGEHDYTL
jgi:putative aminopeptidase FrvX